MTADDRSVDADARWGLHGRVAVVTRAGSGIGAATAPAFPDALPGRASSTRTSTACSP